MATPPLPVTELRLIAKRRRRILFLLILPILVPTAIEFFGFDTGTRFENEIDGVKISIIHPRFVNWYSEGSGVSNNDQIRDGYSMTYHWTEPFGRVLRDRHVIELVNFKLRIDRRDYGEVSLADSVVVDGQSVKVVKCHGFPRNELSGQAPGSVNPVNLMEGFVRRLVRWSFLEIKTHGLAVIARLLSRQVQCPPPGDTITDGRCVLSERSCGPDFFIA